MGLLAPVVSAGLGSLGAASSEKELRVHRCSGPLRRRPYFLCSHTFSRPVTVQAGDTERLTLFPRPRSRSLVVRSVSSVSLRKSESSVHRTPCGRCRVPRQRSYVESPRIGTGSCDLVTGLPRASVGRIGCELVCLSVGRFHLGRGTPRDL